MGLVFFSDIICCSLRMQFCVQVNAVGCSEAMQLHSETLDNVPPGSTSTRNRFKRSGYLHCGDVLVKPVKDLCTDFSQLPSTSCVYHSWRQWPLPFFLCKRAAILKQYGKAVRVMTYSYCSDLNLHFARKHSRSA